MLKFKITRGKPARLKSLRQPPYPMLFDTTISTSGSTVFYSVFQWKP